MSRSGVGEQDEEEAEGQHERQPQRRDHRREERVEHRDHRRDQERRAGLRRGQRRARSPPRPTPTRQDDPAEDEPAGAYARPLRMPAGGGRGIGPRRPAADGRGHRSERYACARASASSASGDGGEGNRTPNSGMQGRCVPVSTTPPGAAKPRPAATPAPDGVVRRRRGREGWRLSWGPAAGRPLRWGTWDTPRPEPLKAGRALNAKASRRFRVSARPGQARHALRRHSAAVAALMSTVSRMSGVTAGEHHAGGRAGAEPVEHRARRARAGRLGQREPAEPVALPRISAREVERDVGPRAGARSRAPPSARAGSARRPCRRRCRRRGPTGTRLNG